MAFRKGKSRGASRNRDAPGRRRLLVSLLACAERLELLELVGRQDLFERLLLLRPNLVLLLVQVVELGLHVGPDLVDFLFLLGAQPELAEELRQIALQLG